LRLVDGVLSFCHRDKPGQIQIITRGTAAGIEGTEFAMAEDQNDKTTVSVIDGKVKLTNPSGTLVLTNGQQAEVVLGKAPVRSAGFIVNDVLQWVFYYPAVLDVKDLQLTEAEKHSLQDSLAAYQAGDLARALKYFPARAPDSTPVKIYHAALLLSVGNVADAQRILTAVPARPEKDQRLAAALGRLIAAVKLQPDVQPQVQPGERPFQPKLATEFLADSYYQQSGAIRGVSLENALDRAKQAVAVSPGFSLAWERVAELEFCFGHTKNSLVALDKSLALAPQNPKALVLKGFLMAAQNRAKKAIGVFDQALAINSALGDAWLGRGLCEIRAGDRAQGREDLLVAAALEPQRAELRSYLGKAYADAGDFPRAEKELDLAKNLDPADPTAWLYSALLNQERNRINTAIDDLEKSEDLNDNRRVYRSDHLLDQDQAVRSANLASIYNDADMTTVGLQEAQKAISYDYDNYSAHLFLANTYDELRDPNQINLRYDTPAASEYLVANLLAPASAGTLSTTISQDEYSRMFERDGFGVTSDTEYLSRGAWLENGDQFGTFKDFSYDFGTYYRSDPGQRPNNDIEERDFSLALKQQLTLQDTLFFQVSDNELNSGDRTEYYDQADANTEYRVHETQQPIVGLGYNHEWAPGVNTLFYVTRLNDEFTETNTDAPATLVFTPGSLGITGVESYSIRENYTDQLNIYSGELQQIFEGASHTTILGTRLQYGHFNTGNLENYVQTGSYFPQPYGAPDADQFYTTLFRRLTLYGYHDWEILDSLHLIGGVAYDELLFPENFTSAPISNQERDEHQVSPKAGLVWTPTEQTTFRMAYTRSLAGASLDQTVQIEPSQVAGFIQSYRSIIPESISGSQSGARFETYDISLEQKFWTRTYLTLSGEMLNSTVDRMDGAFDFAPPHSFIASPSAGLEENLDYHERTLLVAVNQLLGKNWTLGAQYRWSQAVLGDNYPAVPSPVLGDFTSYQKTKGLLNQLDFTAAYNHPSGFFAEGEATWYSQYNSGYVTADNPAGEPGDSFWELNAFVGYRSPHRRIQTSLGLLNIANQGYNLNPLNLYNELPYKRTIALSFQINF
jgi:Flp pilus assembly protein TadD